MFLQNQRSYLTQIDFWAVVYNTIKNTIPSAPRHLLKNIVELESIYIVKNRSNSKVTPINIMNNYECRFDNYEVIFCDMV
jgi:hypothetical protein